LVEAGLRFLNRHQSPDGRWDVDGYQDRCGQPGPRCEPGEDSTPNGEGDVLLTAEALLCFALTGYDHATVHKYRSTVARARAWLGDRQGEDGAFADDLLIHARVLPAFAWLVAMADDPELRTPIDHAVDHLRGSAVRLDGEAVGWGRGEGRCETATMAAIGEALRCCDRAGFAVDAEIAAVRRWFERVDGLRDPEAPYPAAWIPADRVLVEGDAASTAQAALLAHRQGFEVRGSLATVTGFPADDPPGFPLDLASFVPRFRLAFHRGGEDWRGWNLAFRDLAVAENRREPPCFDGSWDPGGAGGAWESLGRPMATAGYLQCLAVYYRYVPIDGAD